MQETQELCRDIQMKMPDSIWMLDSLERYRRGALMTDDFARMDGKTYVFGVVEVPFAYTEGSFTWGTWAEVDPSLHDAYLNAFRTPEADALAGTGTLANDIPGYEDSQGACVDIVFSSSRRPVFVVSPAVSLGEDQKKGLSLEEHRMLDEILFGDNEDDEDFEDAE